MPDSGIVPQETRERIERIGNADLVIALTPPMRDPASLESAIARVRESVAAFSPTSRTVIVHPIAALNSGDGNANDADNDTNGQWQLLPHPSLTFGPSMPLQSFSESLRVVFGI